MAHRKGRPTQCIIGQSPLPKFHLELRPERTDKENIQNPGQENLIVSPGSHTYGLDWCFRANREDYLCTSFSMVLIFSRPAAVHAGQEEDFQKLRAQRGCVLRPVRKGAFKPVSRRAARRNLGLVESSRNLEPGRPPRQYRFLSGWSLS
ncbi:hypothetical protein MUG91_G22n100 [Manis pentadactyla]|nr:hypothetical protein MUG91_G22n100 [Manis pentadactyla]